MHLHQGIKPTTLVYGYNSNQLSYLARAEENFPVEFQLLKVEEINETEKSPFGKIVP